jgi:mRNA interferase MazF
MVSRGDVCWVETPEDGRRPMLILSRAEAIPVLHAVTAAIVTRRMRGIPTEVRLGVDDGMPEECVVSLDNLRHIQRAFLTEPITTLSGPRMHQVCRALAIATGCN